MRTILHGLTRADIEPEPFPHVVVDGALEPELYRELASTMPAAEKLLAGRSVQSNTAYRYAAERILADAPPVWQEFVRVHTSPEFFAEVVALFGDAIRRIHPTLEQRVGRPLMRMRTNVRAAEPFADAALDLPDCVGIAGHDGHALRRRTRRPAGGAVRGAALLPPAGGRLHRRRSRAVPLSRKRTGVFR